MAKKKVVKKKTSKKTSKKASALEELGSWMLPQLLLRPNRREYVLKIIKPKGCVFCHCAKVGVSVKSLVLYKGKHCMVVINKYPYNNGHLLILPIRHCGEYLELSQNELEEFNALTRHSIDAISQAFHCVGMNVGMNLGAVSGAGIPDHLHQHVIPRWLGDTNFFPLIAKSKVLIETLEQVYERLLPYFEKL